MNDDFDTDELGEAGIEILSSDGIGEDELEMDADPILDDVVAVDEIIEDEEESVVEDEDDDEILIDKFDDKTYF